MRSSNSDAAPPAITARLQLTLAFIAGGGAANVYYHQPMLGLLQSEFGASAPTAIATSTLMGYGAGILLLVPLGDAWPRRTLIVAQCFALAAALACAAMAPGFTALTIASAFVGAFATTAQQAIPFAAELAPANARGRVVGRTMTGLLLGVLLARTASGALADWHGWRFVFAAAAAMALLTALIAATTLPYTHPAAKMRYRALLASLVVLLREEPVLRWATLTQGCIFAAFNAFWASLALHLASTPFLLGPASAGLYGLIGATGAVVAPLSGRLSDRYGPSAVVTSGAAIVLASFLVLSTVGRASLGGLAAGVLVLDVGASLAMISNQTRIYSLRPEARGRLNTVHMTGVFLAGGLGASLGTRGFALGGWTAVCALGVIFSICALLSAVGTRA